MDGRFDLVEVMRALRVYINAPSLHAFPICEVGYRLMSKMGGLSEIRTHAQSPCEPYSTCALPHRVT